MPSERTRVSEKRSPPRTARASKLMMVLIAIATVLSVASLAVGIATLVKVYSGSNDQSGNPNSSIASSTSTAGSTSTVTPMSPSTTVGTTATVSTSTPTTTAVPSMVNSIQISETMGHLQELQRIADMSNGNRAVNTIGFNRTLDYIYNSLTSNTDFTPSRAFFTVRNFVPGSNQVFVTSINGTVQNRTYSTNFSVTEFAVVQYTRPLSFVGLRPITVIPNVGCTDADYESAIPPPAGQIVLVKRGTCTFVEKGSLASKYNVTALLIYNDGTVPANIPPVNLGLGRTNELPAVSLSYTLGQQLVNAAADPANNVTVNINIDVADESVYPIGNICADTPTGDPTQTIVIGSHSDSVPAGPGINDNGSGSATNLALAATLSRLFRTPAYPKFKYRVRFCWFGGEEIGLLGSDFHVRAAVNATTVGDRIGDYLINLNYDMLGSPNFILGIYDGKTATNSTPVQALAGSNKITAEFVGWFNRTLLPWSYTDFSGRSDYGPFLAQGVVAGGLFTGADDTKTKEERDYYDKMLGPGLGGIAGIIHDPCYHRACDSIENINVFALEKMNQAAAHMLEFLGQQDDLKTWLYPSPRTQQSGTQREYDSINEYFRLPYL